jgi:CRISPR-associated protein Cas2
VFVVVSYDIPDDKRRNKIARTLEDYGARVQYSVFEVNLDPRQVAKMRQELVEIAQEDVDSIRFYTLCGACYARIEVLGAGRAAETPPEALII